MLLKSEHGCPEGSRFHADPCTTEREAKILDSAVRLLAEVQRGDMEEALRETSEGEVANDGCADALSAPKEAE